MRNRGFVFIFLSFIVFSGCSKSIVLFTDEYRGDFEGQLQNVQFYISDKIVLRREIEEEEKSVTRINHSIRIESNKKILEITVPKQTEGTLKKIEGDTLYVQFEPSPDGEERTIPFTKIKREERIAIDPGYVYQFRAKKIIYEGKEYFVSFRKKDIPIYIIKEGKQIPSYYINIDSFPLLKINPVQQFNELEKEHRTASGMRVGE